MAIGVPGCPEFAFWTASIERVRIVLIASVERSDGCDMVWVTFRNEVARWNHLGMDSASTGGRIDRECLRLCAGFQLTSRASAFVKLARHFPAMPEEPEALEFLISQSSFVRVTL